MEKVKKGILLVLLVITAGLIIAFTILSILSVVFAD